MRRLRLEILEDRVSPSVDLFGYSRVEVAAPANISNLFALREWVELETFVGQWGVGIPWRAGRIVQVDVSAAQMEAFVGQENTVARMVVPVGDWLFSPTGRLPVILCPPEFTSFGDGQRWEETSLYRGWWDRDWRGGIDTALMPWGPQHGESFGAPNYAAADALLSSGNPYWWWFI